MKKKLVIVALIMMVFLGSINVGQASGKVSSDTDSVFPDRLQRAASVDVYTETDPDRLEQIAKEDGIEVPEGYSLVSVTTKFVPLEAEKEQVLKEDAGVVSPMSTYITYITNVQSAGNKYYSSDYDSYNYTGPSSVSTTYSQTRSSNYTATTSVSSSLVSSAVGFSVNSSWTYSQGYATTVPAGQLLVVRVHMNYSVKTFDVYRRLSTQTTGTKIGSGSAWRPIGLLIKEYRYS